MKFPSVVTKAALLSFKIASDFSTFMKAQTTMGELKKASKPQYS